ncbi:MAG: DUF427 domain-containing protein [Anaerolineales bacterium]|nr:DUF427 domain-containing protein [Anaerolineales bacterium]
MKFREEPGPGQESVWDYPRPPRLEASTRHIQVEFNNVIIASTRRALRVLETSHPPVYYIPPEDIRPDVLKPTPGKTMCEWKGQTSYYNVEVSDRKAQRAAWYYPEPAPGFEGIRNYVAFYPSKMDRCSVDGQLVRAQEGDFYGGWITSEIVGPFKGGAGTLGW